MEKQTASSSSTGPRAEILCVLQSGSTQVEQTLCAGGRAIQARQARTELLQEAAKNAFCERLESLTHRKVESFVSGYCPESDVTTLVFLLAK
jgi:uncharacterized protein YbcI